MLFVQQQYVLNTHGTLSPYALAVAISYSNNQQQQQIYSVKTKYINIVISIIGI